MKKLSIKDKAIQIVMNLQKEDYEPEECHAIFKMMYEKSTRILEEYEETK